MHPDVSKQAWCILTLPRWEKYRAATLYFPVTALFFPDLLLFSVLT